MQISKILASALLIGALSQSHAIVGLGGHYLLSPGAGVDGKTEVIKSEPNSGSSLNLQRGSLDQMQGFGVKLWIDALPFVDIEGTGNFAFGSYDAALVLQSPLDTAIIPIEAEMEFPGYSTKAKPLAFIGSGDLSVTYPFLKFPPAISILRLYAGAGISYTFQSAVLNKSFVDKAASSELDAFLNAKSEAEIQDAATQAATKIAKEIASEGLEYGVGAHVIVGARAKLPIIPIAAYANYKYYLGGFQSPINAGQAIELGGGIAF